MNRYGDVKYTREDIERIIANKERRLEDLEQCWDGITKHMECGEIRELKESCIDDEIIISCLRKSSYLELLIETWKRLNEELEHAAEKLAANLPSINELKDGNYVLKYDQDIWDMQTAYKFFQVLVEGYPNSTFTLLPAGIELIETDKIDKNIED